MTDKSFGPYRLLDRLGRGGMGEVWRAVDTRKDREVALKVLGSWMCGDPHFAARFKREAALAARLNAPNIVPIHDYGQIDDRLFIDMPLVPGTDLAKLLRRGALEPERAVAIVAQVARGLAVAHEAGLVHRDVKPSNVLVSITADGDDHAYLIDFGITKALDGTRLSMTVGCFGTPAYMAPECFLGDGDARSDIYALGCILYEALTGKAAFTAPHPFAYANLHQTAAPPLPTARNKGVPSALDAVVACALAKDPDARYARVTELSGAARAALAEVAEPVVATPEQDDVPTVGSPADRTTSSVIAPRRPRSAVLGATLTGHLGGVLAVATTQLHGRPVAVSGSIDHTIRMWDLAKAAPTGRRVIRRVGSVFALAVTLLDRRPVVISGADEGRLRIWDLDTRLDVAGRLTGHKANVQGVAIARVDGRSLAVTVGTDQTVRVWDLDNSTLVGKPLVGHRHYVFAVAIARLGDRPVAVTVGADEVVRTWDLRSQTPAGKALTGHDGPVLAVATARLDGRPIAVTGGIDGSARVWDLANRRQLGPSFTGHHEAVRAVAVAHLNGRPVAVTGGEDEAVRLWDLTTGSAIGPPLLGHAGWVTSIAVTELDGRTVAVTGSEDRTLRIWDISAAASAG